MYAATGGREEDPNCECKGEEADISGCYGKG